MFFMQFKSGLNADISLVYVTKWTNMPMLYSGTVADSISFQVEFEWHNAGVC